MSTLKIFTITSILLLTFVFSFSQERYWVNGSGNWNDSYHWSDQSGGQGGASIPTKNNDVIFDENSSSAQTRQIDISVDQNAECKIIFSETTDYITFDNIDKIEYQKLFLLEANNLHQVFPIEKTTNIRALDVSITFNTSYTEPLCNSGCDATASVDELSVVGGAGGPYTYQWFPLSTTCGNVVGRLTSSISNIRAGTYTVRVYDNIGNYNSKNVQVTEPGPIVLSSIITNPLCSSSCDGEIDLIITGGTTPFNYLWSNSTSSIPASGLCPGSYGITVTDANLCTGNDIFEVTSPDSIILSFNKTDVLCKGENTGNASVSVSGGTLPYSYTWDPDGEIVDNITNKPAGNYTVTITDGNSCEKIGSIAITEPTDSLKITSAISSGVTPCFGDANGTITAVVSGGTSPYTFDIGIGPTNTDGLFSGLSGGSYTVTVTDANFCTATSSIVVVDEPTAMTLNINVIENVRCHGLCDGKAKAIPTGGITPYNYLWDCTGQTTDTISGLCAGDCNLTVSDDYGCTISDVVTITEPDTLIASITPTNPTCNNGNDGEMEAIPTGGTAGYGYAWSCSGLTTQTISGLGAGSCTVTITDDSLCTATATATLINPPAINLSISSSDTKCNGSCDGNASITPTSGTAPFVFDWSPNGFTGDGTDTYSNLCAGTYFYTVTDQNGAGCSVNGSIIIGEPSAITININTTDVSCFGDCDGTATAFASGGNNGFNYSWNNGQNTQTATNLCAGDWYVTATDVLGCTAIDTATINSPSEIQINGVVTNVSCAGETDGTISITVTGGTSPYTYFWYSPDGGSGISNPFAQNQSSLSENTFIVVIDDASSCEARDTFILSHNSALPPATIDVTNVLCFGESTGSIDVTLVGATAPTFSWLPGGEITEDLTNIPIGHYCVHIEDNGCSFDTCVDVGTAPLLTVITNVSNPTCNGVCDGSITLNVGGGTTPYNFDWSPNGYTGDGTATYSNLCGGITYNYTVVDGNGCTSTGSENLINPAGMNFSGTTFTDPSCMGLNDGSIDLNVNGGTSPFTFSWTGGYSSEDLSNLLAGTYCVTVTDGGGCTKDTCITLTDPPGMDITIGTTSKFLISATTEIEVCFSATHTYVSDLGFYLVAPDGIGTIELLPSIAAYDDGVTSLPSSYYGCSEPSDVGANCNSGDNVNNLCFTSTLEASNSAYTACVCDMPAPLSGTFASFGPWNAIYGEEPGQGKWAVQIYDCVGIDVGFLTHATIRFTDYDQFGNGPYTYFYDSDVIASTINDNSCDAISASIFTAPINIQVSCNGDCDATLYTNTTNGTSPYTYLWDDLGNSTNDTLYNLCAGNYNVTVTDDNGCQGTASATITEPLPLTSGISATPETCSGNCNGTATVTPSGGTPPYNIIWSDGASQTTTTASGLCAGVYTVTITDSKLCTFDTTITVNSNAILLVTENITSPSCYNTADGSISLSVSGGTSPYTYLWWNASTGNSVSGLSSGSYCYTVTDDNGCNVQNCANLNGPDTIRFNATVTELTCYNDNDGIIDINVTGVTSPTYTWNPAVSVTSVASGLSTGNYYFEVDNNGCTKDTTITINNPTAIDFDFPMIFDASCYNSCDGFAQINNITGNIGVTTITWGSGDVGNFAFTLCPGTTPVHVEDENGCFTDSSVTITAPDEIIVNETINDASCGFCNGSISLAVSEGTPPYYYTWGGVGIDDGAGNFSDLCAGTYYVTVEDDNGCTKELSFSISDVGGPIIATNVVVNPLCTGACDGEIQISVTGGVTPYTFVWSNGDDGLIADSLCAGFTSVTVAGDDGCMSTEDYNLVAPNALVLSFSSSDLSCFDSADGLDTVFVAGGTNPYTYTWSNGASNSFTSGLDAGEICVTVTDVNGCSANACDTLYEPTELTSSITAQTDATCFGDSDGNATVSISGGTGNFNYVWSNFATTNNSPLTTNTAYGLSATNYFVEITDKNGCQDTAYVTIGEASEIVISGTITNANCGSNDGSISISISGGSAPYTPNWNPVITGGPVYSGLLAGSYNITVTDDNGCTNDTTFVVGNIGGPSITVDTVIHESCFGLCDGQIEFTVTDGIQPYSYAWTPVSTDTTSSQNLCSGNYVVTVTGQNGCFTTESFTINPADEIVITASSILPTCNGDCNGEISINISGGVSPYSILWGTGNPQDTTATLSNLCAGNYDVTVTDANGCQKIYSVGLTEPDLITFDILMQFDASCYNSCDGFAQIGNIAGGTSPYTITWGSGDVGNFAFSLCPGVTTIHIEDANGCFVDSTITIGAPDEIMLASNITDASCSVCNGNIEVIPSGGVSPYYFTWSPLGGVDDGLGNYSDLCSGLYYVTVEDDYGCFKIDTNSVNDIGSPTVTVESVIDASCYGTCDGEIIVSATGGALPYTFEWSSSSNTDSIETGLCAGSHFVSVTGDDGCQRIENIEITEPDSISITINGQDVSCFGLCDGSATPIVSGGTAPYTFAWSNLTTDSIVTNLCAGVYILTVTDFNLCTNTATIEIFESNDFIINVVSQSDASCNGICDGAAQLNISGGTTPYTIDWCNGESGIDADSLCAGTCDVTITDVNSCTTTTSVTIGEPDAINISFNITNSNCNQTDGAIDATISGGQTPYNFEWSSGEVTEDISNIAAGADTLTVTDFNGCSNSEVAIVIDENAGTISFTDVQDNLCFGDTSGQAIAVMNGGTAPFSYAWNATYTDSLAYNLGAGTYNVVITDSAGCISSNSISIVDSSEIIITVNITEISCSGMNDGSISISVTGGTSSFTYLWDNAGETDSVITNLSAGTYCVTVTDSNGCIKTACYTIAAPPSGISLSFSTTNPVCYGDTGAIDLTVTGGVSPYDYLWSNAGEVSEDISGIYAEWHIVTVTDDNGCQAIDSTEITQPNEIILSYSITNSHCTITDGAIEVIPSGGTPGYSYLWDSNAGNQITAIASNLTSGTYFVTVTDTLSCSVSGSATIIDVDAGTISFTNVVHNDCYGQSIGQAIAEITGGTAPYIYNWNTAFTDSLVENLAAGDYIVTIIDAGNCISSDTITITEPAELNISFIVTDVTCFGVNDGSITANVSGGISPYTYTWLSFGNTSTISGLYGGNYYLTVEDVNLCSINDSTSISAPSSALTTSIIGSDVLCPAENNGQADLTVSGGTSPYTYLWTGGESTEDAYALAEGINYVTVTDSLGCTTIDSVNISAPQPLVLSTTDVQNSNCTFADGSATIVASGGTPPYTYSWPTGDTTATVDTLRSGLYIVSVTDAYCPTETINVLISDSSAYILFTNVHHNPCFGYSEGTVTAEIFDDPYPPYNYSWFPNNYTNPDSATYSNLPAGEYFIAITNSMNCLTVDTININQPDSTILIFNPTNPSCNGDSDGKIDVTVTGSSTSYSYLWSNGMVIQDIFAIPSNTYTLTVTDGNGCISIDSVELINPPIIEASIINTTNNVCYGESNGAINISVTGGTSPYSFIWNNDSVSQNISGLASGNYSVTITDANDCSTTLDTIIYEPTEILATFNNTSAYCGSCVGASQADITGGITPYSYLWDDGSINSSISNLCVGFYFLTVNDANGCISTHTVEINDTSNVSANIISFTPISCNGVCDATVTIEGTGGTNPYTYNWSIAGETETFVDSICAGTYYVTVVDDNLCSDAAEVVVPDVNALNIQLLATDISCNGLSDGSISAYIIGGTPEYTISWSIAGNDTIIENLFAGTYAITVNDINGCTFIDSTEIIEPAELSISVINYSDVTCYGECNGSATVQAIGGTAPFTYEWDGSTETGQSVSSLCAGIIGITATDIKGCFSTENITINEPGEIIGTFSNITQVSCGGGNEGTATINVTGGTSPYSYVWDGISNIIAPQYTQTAVNLVGDLYIVSVTDFNGCIDTSMIEIVDTSNLDPNITNISDATCFGNCNGSATLIISGGTPEYHPQWSTGDTTITVSNLCAGMHFVTITDDELCSRIRIAEIGSPEAISVSHEIKSITCNGECDAELTLHASGGTPPFTYHWISLQTPSTDSISTGLCEGNYIANVQDSNGCLYFMSDSMQIIAPSIISTSYITDLTTCENSTNDGGINLSVSGGIPPYTYLWLPDSITTQDLNNIPSGYYSVTVTDDADCIINIDSIAVNASIIIVADAGPDTSICLGQSVQLFGYGADTLLWSPTELLSDSTSAFPIVSPTDSTMFILTARNICYDTDTIMVNIYPLLNIEASDDVEIYYDDVANLSVDGGDEFTTYYWTPSTGLSDTTIYDPEAQPEETTLYYVFTTNQYGCVQHDSVLVSIIPRIKFPTGFTPNGDGINDTWIIDYLDYYPEIEVEIFNRWGESIWYSKGYNEPWDGTTTKGKVLPMGTYYYIINVNNEYEKHVISGPVTIMK